MSRARDRADGVDLSTYSTTSSIASTYAPLSSPTFTGTTNISSGVTLPAGHIIKTYNLQGSSGSDYELDVAYTNTSLTDNTHYDTGNYFKLTPNSATNTFIFMFQALIYRVNSTDDGGFSLIIGGTPSGGSESKPITCQDRTSLSGHEHSGHYHNESISAEGAWADQTNRTWWFTCGSAVEHTFKIYVSPYQLNSIRFHSHGNTKMHMTVMEKQE